MPKAHESKPLRESTQRRAVEYRQLPSHAGRTMQESQVEDHQASAHKILEETQAFQKEQAEKLEAAQAQKASAELREANLKIELEAAPLIRRVFEAVSVTVV